MFPASVKPVSLAFSWTQLPDFSHNTVHHLVPGARIVRVSQCGPKTSPKPAFLATRSVFKLSQSQSLPVPCADFRFPYCKFLTGFVDKKFAKCLKGGNCDCEMLSESLHLTVT